MFVTFCHTGDSPSHTLEASSESRRPSPQMYLSGLNESQWGVTQSFKVCPSGSGSHAAVVHRCLAQVWDVPHSPVRAQTGGTTLSKRSSAQQFVLPVFKGTLCVLSKRLTSVWFFCELSLWRFCGRLMLSMLQAGIKPLIIFFSLQRSKNKCFMIKSQWVVTTA